MELTQTVEPSLIATLAPLIERRQELKAKIAEMEKEIEGDKHTVGLNDQIKNTLVQAGQLEVVAAGHKLTLDLEAEKSSLDKQKLVEQGVTTAQIQKATKTTKYIRLDIRKVKETAE